MIRAQFYALLYEGIDANYGATGAKDHVITKTAANFHNIKTVMKMPIKCIRYTLSKFESVSLSYRRKDLTKHIV